MNDKTNQYIFRAHNVAIVIITVSCIGAIIESLSQGWELWVPPLIAFGIIACWAIHINRYGSTVFRENFLLTFSMMVAFFHGVHATSFFDIVVISLLLLVTALTLHRKEFLTFILVEFCILMAGQCIYGLVIGTLVLDPLVISRIILHFVVEICIYKALMEMIKNFERFEVDFGKMKSSEDLARSSMEDFLVNVSHELRTPVNVINGMSSLILKREVRADVVSIRDAGMRLSHQIEDIQDYSEIQRGGAVLEVERYAIVSLLNDLATGYSLMGQRKNLEFIIDLDPNVPSVMRGDSQKIKKIITHLLDNAYKFTNEGGIYLKVACIRKEYGVNLIIEVSDTGIGMTDREREKVSKGSYQADSGRNRNTGGIGLGLSIVYGFTRLMNGFVSIDSIKNYGTTVRVSVIQEVLDPTPCLSLGTREFLGVAFHVLLDRFSTSQVPEFYKTMATNMASGLRVNLYSAPTLSELKKLLDTGKLTHVFMGPDEYEEASAYFDEIAKDEVTVIVSADKGYAVNPGSRVIVMPKPLYGYPVVKILNGETKAIEFFDGKKQNDLNLEGVRVLVVDDEPMNLVVATGLFRDYKMEVDTAESGREALNKYDIYDYDIVFMDHMMPEMDGVETMKRLRFISEQKGKPVKVIALTANAVSGAREMFLKEGFDGFITKPININDFERVISRVLSEGGSARSGGVK